MAGTLRSEILKDLKLGKSVCVERADAGAQKNCAGQAATPAGACWSELPTKLQHLRTNVNAIHIVCKPELVSPALPIEPAYWSPDAPDRAVEGLPVAGTKPESISRAPLSQLRPAPADRASPGKVQRQRTLGERFLLLAPNNANGAAREPSGLPGKGLSIRRRVLSPPLRKGLQVGARPYCREKGVTYGES